MVDGDVNGWNVYGQLQDFVFMTPTTYKPN